MWILFNLFIYLFFDGIPSSKSVMAQDNVVPEHVIRLMRKEDIQKVLEIWIETGFQEGTKCVDTWFEVDPEGFYVAATDSGEILGVCSAVFSTKDLAFVGFYTVQEKYRGKGIGPRIWQACMDHIGDSNAAVNAVPGKMELYRDRGGFPLVEKEWLSISCETENDVDPIVLLNDVEGVEVRKLRDDEDLPLIIDYDEALIGYNREKIISLTVKEEDSVSFVALRDGKCVGYGVLKMSVQGHGQVGPLYADSQEIAEVILRRLIENLPKTKGLALMIVSSNEGAKAIVGKTGMKGIECPRLYKLQKHDVDKSKVFGQLDLSFSIY